MATRNAGRRTERAVWTRVGVGDEKLDLLVARFYRHHYAPHAHEEFAIGLCVDGLEDIRYRNASHSAGPGSIVVLEPGEAHTGGPATADGFAYWVMYPSTALLSDGAPSVHFPTAIVDDAQLVAEFRRIHLGLAGAWDALTAQSRLAEAFRTLITRHAVSHAPGAPPPLAAGRIAEAVRSRLGDQLVQPPGLSEIAADLGLSRYQVTRAFRQVTGMPPYAWLAQHRVWRARALLDAGERPSDVAALVGFADQAHLTRWFRRVIGVPPGVYRNSVQDLRPDAA